MKIKRNQVIIAVVVAIVGFLLVNRFMQKPKAAPAAPAALVVAADLKDMKYQILNSSKTEMYRSGDSTAHTIAGTILEQAIDIIVAVLEQPQVVEVGNSIIASKEDADNVATMIEEVGKDVASALKDTPADRFLNEGLQSAYTTLQSSLKDEVDKTDIWFPILQKVVAEHGSKQPISMNEKERKRIKNAKKKDIKEARDAIKQLIDEDFGRSRRGDIDARRGVGGDRPRMAQPSASK
jgi:energy-converting hydrogenase Eha subunit B